MEQSTTCLQAEDHRYVCLHVVNALGSHFVVTCGNPAPGNESSPVIYSAVGNPAFSHPAFLRG